MTARTAPNNSFMLQCDHAAFRPFTQYAAQQPCLQRRQQCKLLASPAAARTKHNRRTAGLMPPNAYSGALMPNQVSTATPLCGHRIPTGKVPVGCSSASLAPALNTTGKYCKQITLKGRAAVCHKSTREARA